MAKIVVEKSELEGLRDNISSILRTGSNITIPVSEQIYEDYELNKNEDIVVKYLDKNPGSSIEQVVSGCKISRATIFKTIDALVARGLVLKREDKIKHRTYHLFVNHQDVAFSFEKDLRAFKHFYTSLIDYTSKELIRLSNYKMNKSKIDNLIEAIIGPYRFLYTMYITSDILLWDKRPLDEDTLHRKYSVFVKVMNEIHIEIVKLLSDNRSNQIANQLLYDNTLGFSKSHLQRILKTLDEYELNDYAEPVIDVLWHMSYPILPLIYPSNYEKQFRDGTLKDWRNLFKGKPEPTYKPRYEMLPLDE